MNLGALYRHGPGPAGVEDEPSIEQVAEGNARL